MPRLVSTPMCCLTTSGLNAAPLSLSTTENVPSLTTQTPNFLAGGPAQISNAIFTLPTTQERTAISAYLPNQVLPYSEQWTLGVQHVFAHIYTAEVRYVGTRGIHLDTQTQINSQAAATTANQLPTNVTGGSVTPNGANTLATLTANTGQLHLHQPHGRFHYGRLPLLSHCVVLHSRVHQHHYGVLPIWRVELQRACRRSSHGASRMVCC